MLEPLKIKFINKDDIIENFITEHPEYKGKELTVNITPQSYDIKYKHKLLDLVQPLNGYEFKESGRLYGYARIICSQQSIERQIQNIKTEYPSVVIVQDAIKREIRGQ